MSLVLLIWRGEGKGEERTMRRRSCGRWETLEAYERRVRTDLGVGASKKRKNEDARAAVPKKRKYEGAAAQTTLRPQSAGAE